ncbi:MAG: helix-turn-helix transcriptional regulator [Ignavibacteriae bacterium]|nr:helix-turn-helix transcriptional regulator [Ignavibacteriota bacterium]
MSDLQRYIQQRKNKDKEFAEEYDAGYTDFKIGILLRQFREELGLTQDDIARKLKTRRSAISRIENHADEIRLSMLKRYAKVIGKKVRVELA